MMIKGQSTKYFWSFTEKTGLLHSAEKLENSFRKNSRFILLLAVQIFFPLKKVEHQFKLILDCRAPKNLCQAMS